VPIKWSAVKVSEAMDEIETQLNYARPFINEAQHIAEEVKHVPNLPEYINQPRRSLSERLGYVHKGLFSYIERIRSHIPDGAIEAEREATKHGSTQLLM